jgi:hypothetical protein
MSYNGSGTFTINTTGQPVVAGTVITASAFNSLTTDLATGLTTAITKDGQTTTTARITFAQGITSSLVTDSSSISTGSIITAGGAGIAKNLYVGGALDVAGATTFTNPVINNIKMGYTTTATAAGATTLTISSNYRQFFTGTTTQTIVLPVTSTLVTGIAYEIENNSTGLLTVNSSGGNLVGTIPAGVCAHAVCIGTTLTTAADWDWDYISTTTITGTGANVLGTSPTITTPTISSLSSAASTALTLQSAGTTAVTIDTSQNVGIGCTPTQRLQIAQPTAVEFDMFVGSTRTLTLYADATQTIIGAPTAVPMIFKTTDTERMRIDSSGNVLVGTTSNPDTNRVVIKGGDGNQLYLDNAGTTYTQLTFANNGTRKVRQFFDNSLTRFYIDCNGTGGVYLSSGATSWTAASDERVKDIIEPIENATQKLSSWRTVVGKYKADAEGTRRSFLIAQDVLATFPEAVDTTNADEYGLNYQDTIPVLVKAIQEQQALITAQAATITTLTARITALENA